jgi:glycosyltransferase involved in cell wall biosynthesis
MRILWLSNGPFVPSGYGVETALFVPRIAALGHEISVYAPYSYAGAPLAWGEHTVFGSAGDTYGNDALAGHYQALGCDLLLTLCDIFKLIPSVPELARMNVAHWLPVDCEPASEIDLAVLRDGGGTPVAMSRFGQRMIEDEGCNTVHYVPHGVDTALFAPGDLHEGPFTVGINAVNKDMSPRKGLPGQMLAFARFRERHPEARLAMHTASQAPHGLNLAGLANRLGVTDAVDFPDLYSYASGVIPAEAVAEWYRGLDVLSNCSLGEGFGLPIIEAQASGVPVIVTDASSMTELRGAGWLVNGEKHWADGHNSWWTEPYPQAIEAAYEAAWQAREDGRAPEFAVKAREFAVQYDADRVLKEHWEPVLATLEAALT